MITLPLLFLRRKPVSVGEERVMFKHRLQKNLQRFVLRSKDLRPFRVFYASIYSLAIRLFVRFTLRAERETGLRLVEAIYLRRGGGRGELVLGASDLDFFVVLHTVSAQQEMQFLKRFWKKYSFYRNILPFLGETLMGDRNELEDWLQTGCVRAFETSFSWRRIHGKDVLQELPAPAMVDQRDMFSEALKCYWALVQPVLKMQDEHFSENLELHGKSAVLLRHGVKAALDLFRLHFTFGKSRNDALRICELSRAELIEKLPPEIYGDFLPRFHNLLSLREPVLQGRPLEMLSALVFTAFRCLDEMAASLEKDDGENLVTEKKLIYHSEKAVSDPYSLSVRELFAERILFRHQALMWGCVLSEATAQMYFRLKTVPNEGEFRELLVDLRNVSFSLERFNVPMPLSERTFKQMEKTSLLDSPFHSFYSHREEWVDENGEVRMRPYPSPVPELPLSMLRKTFSELSFALRMQPAPEQFEHFVEKIFTIVLALRIALEKGEIVTSFHAALERFAAKYPTRHEVLQKQLSPFFSLESEEEKAFWVGVNSLLSNLENNQPARADLLRNAFSGLRANKPRHDNSATKTTDFWINLTPFLRMEMNAVKDRLFPTRPVLKL